MNNTHNLSGIKDDMSYKFKKYTSYLPPTFNSISPKIKRHYCTNPRNVAELKREMIKLDISSFQFKSRDFYQINHFTQPVDKQLQKRGGMFELEPFNTCDLLKTEGIFENPKINEKMQEFDPLKLIFSETEEKEEKEEKDNIIEDYIIFDLKKNKIVKKCSNIRNMNKSKTNLVSTKEFFSNIEYKDEFKNSKDIFENDNNYNPERIDENNKDNKSFKMNLLERARDL